MRRVLTILLLVWMANGSLLAQTDSTHLEKSRQLVTTQLREMLHVKKLDTLKLPIGTQGVGDTLSTILKKFKPEAIDSLSDRGHQAIEVVNGKLSALQNRVTSAEDTIQKKVDNLTHQVNAVDDKIEEKVDSIRNKIASSVTATEQKVEKKIEQITGKSIDVPGLEKINAGDAPDILPKNVDTALPNLKLPETDGLSVDIPKMDQLDVDVSELKDKLPDAEILNPSTLDKVNDVTEQIQGLDTKLAEAEKYEGDLQNLKDGAPEKLEKLPEEAEQRLSQVSEVEALNEELSKATAEQAKYEALLKQYQDKKLLEQEIKRKAMTVANDYMTQHASKLQDAQKVLAKSKRGLSLIKDVKDVFKTRSDELVGKKYYQRFVPGLTWQTFRKDITYTDFALQLGYRVTPRLNAGVGGIYRVGFSKDFDYYVKGLQTYGGRIFLDFAIAKGLFAHGEFEALKIHPQLIVMPGSTETISTKSYGSYFGLGKRFNITRNLRGNIQGLYRIDYIESLPSANKVSARFGMEYVFRKRKNKITWPKK